MILGITGYSRLQGNHESNQLSLKIGLLRDQAVWHQNTGRLFPGLGTGLGRVRVRQVNTVPYIRTEPLFPRLQFFIHTVCKKWREKAWCNLSRGSPPIINSRTTEQKLNLLFFCPYGYCPRVVRDCDVYLHTNTKYSI